MSSLHIYEGITVCMTYERVKDPEMSFGHTFSILPDLKLIISKIYFLKLCFQLTAMLPDNTTLVYCAREEVTIVHF